MVDLGKGLRTALAKITGAAIIDEKAVKELVKELQRTLISNDVDVKLVFELTKRIEVKALDTKQLRGTSVKEHVVKVVYDELAQFLGERFEPKLGKQRILLLGLYGSGKTTTIGKLAHFYKGKGLSVGLICCDTDRPAAYEQLRTLAEKSGANFYGEKENKNAHQICKNGIRKLQEQNDVIILDSAGRSAFDEELVKQLREINAEFKPDEKYLVVSADLGQVAGKQAKQFDEAVKLTGVIITKIDGSGKGGGALSAVHVAKVPVAFIGTGEKMDELQAFDAKRFVGNLLGFPDLEALMGKVKKIAEEEKLSEKDLMQEKFTIKLFYDQLKAAKKLGPLKGVFSMLGAHDLPQDMLNQSEKKLKKYEAMINSMTAAEKEDASLIRKSRSRMDRIAAGSGARAEDVKEFLTQFERVEKMLGKFKKDRGFRKKLEGMMKGGKFNMPGMN
ncbi:Signal recognition particle 54 kDa protein [Candidatus Gugararchaeum adminiculabundum]|nr:Signal recognition particle 54 kDa protein [Candidatus Gugararchaeum adminiculabundum]